MRIFGSEKLQSMLSTLGLKKGEVIEHKWLTSSIEKAQKKVEGHNFDIRRQLLEFDNIIDKQRNIIFSKRNSIIDENILEFISDTEDEFITNLLDSDENEILEFSKTFSEIDINNNNQKKTYLNLFKSIKQENFSKHKEAYILVLKQVCLSIIDKNWQNHIQDLNNIKLGVSLSGYGGKDPLNEFRKASFSAFNQLVYEIQKQIVLITNNMNLDRKENSDDTEPLLDGRKKIGRNEPCPCGSGKKYKQCHGKVLIQGK